MTPLRIGTIHALLMVIASVCPPPGAVAQTADLVILNATIHTMDSVRPAATAIAVTGNRISYVGEDSGAKPFIGNGTEVMDLSGKTVVPGFIDSHGHLLGLGYFRMQLDLEGTRNWDDIVRMVAERVRQVKPGEWIRGRGWHQSKWDRPPDPEVRGFQTNDALNAVSPDNPVWLRHASGHAGIANARAMEIAGVGPDTPSPPGGEIVRDSLGRATGMFVELAQSIIENAIARPPKEADQRALDIAAAECVSKGVTTFTDAGVDRKRIAMYKENAAAGTLPLRISAMVGPVEETGPAELFAAPPDTGTPDGFVTARAVKLVMDGALGSRSAWLLEPYSDDSTAVGFETLAIGELDSIAAKALRTGYQVCVHAIGDRANRETLDGYERAFRANPAAARGARFRIEHAQILDERDIPRFGRLGVIASMQGVHCPSDRAWAVDRLGMARIREGAYAWRKLRDAGALIVNGTDTPVEDVDPLKCFYASVTRQRPDGTPPGGYDPDQKMTREEALRSYTIDAAYGIFAERDRGSLRAGKLADLVVLSKDIMAVPDGEILSTKVLATMVNGRFVFRRQE
jgi:predicted amidohydrolase YtcJ